MLTNDSIIHCTIAAIVNCGDSATMFFQYRKHFKKTNYSNNSGTGGHLQRQIDNIKQNKYR